MKGAPLKAAQELMGHSTIKMTERYAHLSPDVRKDAVRAQRLHERRTWQPRELCSLAHSDPLQPHLLDDPE